MKHLKMIGWIICLQMSISVYAQNPNWVIPPENFDVANGAFPTNLPFNSGTALDPLTPNEGVHGGYTSPDGDLMFYTTDEYVYDKNGELAGALEVAGFAKRGISERLILPFGNDCRKYAIIYSAAKNDNEQYGRLKRRQIYMAIYDLDLVDNSWPGEGALIGYSTSSNTTLIDVSHRDALAHGSLGNSSNPDIYGYNQWGSDGLQYNQQIAATQLIDNCYYYVFIFDGENLIRYKLTSTDLEYDNYVYTLPNPGDVDEILRSEMELVRRPNGDYRIALPRDGQSSTSGTINIVDIDDSNGEVISGSLKVLDFQNASNDPILPIGMEFNETGEFLYFTHLPDASTTDELEVYDVANQTILATPALTGIGNFDRSFIERYGDNLYIISTDKIGKLTNINAPITSPLLALDPTFRTITSGYGNEIYHNSVLDQTRYLLPEQIDMTYPDLASFSCACCSAWNSGREGYTATVSATWRPGPLPSDNPFGSVSGDVYMKEDLIIDPGVDITIEGMTFYFQNDAKVIVRREATNETGAYLYLTDGTVFTADQRCPDSELESCGIPATCVKKRWPGIRVEGKGLLNTQEWNASTPHARLKVDENSMIEYAETGAKAGHADLSIFSGGGMIRMKNARIKDCVVGVRFDSFLKAVGFTEVYTRSYIHNSHFSTTNDWFGSVVPSYFVDIEHSSGIYLKGNLYENQIPNSFAIEDRGIGVNVKNARVSSEWYCTSSNINCPTADVVRSEYKNLNYGVYGLNSKSTRTYYEYFSKFTNNFIGVSLNNYINPVVLDNSFSVMPKPNSTGLYLTKSTGYDVEGNHFTTYLGGSANRNIGIHVDNSGDDNNEIYRNTFTNLSRGGLTTNTNSETGTPSKPRYQTGLDWICNEFSTPIHQADIYLDGTMSDEQGDCNIVPAGNLFSTGPTWHYDLYMTSASMWDGMNKWPIDYNHHSGLPLSLVPNPYSQSVPGQQDWLMQACPGVTYNKYTCPVKKTSIPEGYSGPKSSNFNELTSDMVNEFTSELENQIAELQSVIDGGDTEYILELISSLNTDLEMNSDVLNEIILIVENIEGPISEDVLAALQGIDNDMISAVAEEFAFAGAGMSDEEGMLNYYEHELAEYWKEVVTYYISDTLGTISEDEMIGLLQDHQPKTVQRFASIICPLSEQSWIRTANCAYANNAEELGLPELVDGELPRFIPEYFESDYFHMPGNTNILNAHYIEHGGIYDPVVPESELEDIYVEFDGINPFNGGDEGEVSALTVSPNPFSEMVTFDLTMIDFNESIVELVFYDMVGRKVYQMKVGENQYQVRIDAHKLPLGFMTYSLKIDGIPTESGKILRVE